MRFSIVSWHVPQEHGTATGRSLWATCEGLRADGSDVEVYAWGWQSPVGSVPSWCTWEPLPPESWWPMKGRALVRPRSDVARTEWTPAPDGVALSYEPESFAAVEHHPRSAVVLHYSAALDARALRDRSLKRLQDRRAHRRAARRSRAVFAYSDRVARTVDRDARVVPIAYSQPTDPVSPVDEPVAVMFANWHWPPNQLALRWLLQAWRHVLDRAPEARLVLAGRGFEGSVADLPPRVDVIGEVERSRDALEGAAVMAFPCPPTSGPKVKVLEAMSYGVPVVTTPAGAEGLVVTGGRDLVVTEPERFAGDLADLLGDRDRRIRMGADARQAVGASHAPRPAARMLRDAVVNTLDVSG